MTQKTKFQHFPFLLHFWAWAIFRPFQTCLGHLHCLCWCHWILRNLDFWISQLRLKVIGKSVCCETWYFLMDNSCSMHTRHYNIDVLLIVLLWNHVWLELDESLYWHYCAYLEKKWLKKYNCNQRRTTKRQTTPSKKSQGYASLIIMGWQNSK